MQNEAKALVSIIRWPLTALRLLKMPLPSQVQAGFVAGVVLTLLQPMVLVVTAVNILLAVIGLAICWKAAPFWRSLLWPVAALTFGFIWANLNFEQHQTAILPATLQGVDVAVRGRVIGLVTETNEKLPSDIKFRFQVESSQETPLAGRRLQLSCYRCPLKIASGQHWMFTVRLKRPNTYASPSAFDYEKFLFRHQLVATGYLRVKSPHQRLAKSSSMFDQWRAEIRLRLTEALPNKAAGTHIIKALVIGDKSGLTNEQRQVLQVTGVSHLMAISGLHVGLVFFVMLWLTRFLLWPFARIYHYVPRPYLVVIPALIAAVVYSGLAGFAVSTQRALIMLAVYACCRLSGRETTVLNVLLVAMAIILFYDPFSILDVGFWLSCGAVFVIGLSLNGTGSDQSPKLNLLKLQLFLWCGMMPLGVLFFGYVSLVSPIVNLMMVPLFCMLLIPATLGFALLFVGGLDVLGMYGLQWLAHIFDVLFAGLAWVSTLPASKLMSANVTGVHWFGLFLFPILAIASRRIIWFLAMMMVYSLLWLPEKGQRINDLRLTLLDVGQGLSIVIETENEVLVYDTGPRYPSGFNTADAVLIPYLRYRNISRIDRLIVSHADNDHIGGYQALAESIEIGSLLTSRVDKLPEGKRCASGQRWQSGSTLFEIVSPDAGTPEGSNNHSCVLLIRHDGTKVLLTGDIEKQVERYLLEQRISLSADILLVPHQGSKTSSTLPFLRAVNPDLALVAAGFRNHYRHPHPEVVARYQSLGVQLLSTIESGTVQILIGDDGWLIKEYRKDNPRFWRR